MPSTNTLHVRRFEPADRERVRELHADAMRDVGAFVEGAPDPDLDDVTASYLDAGGEFLVGEVAVGTSPNASHDASDGEIVAMGAFRPLDGYLDDFLEDTPARTAEVKRMRVDPASQRRGYGQAIYDELEDRARDAGYAELVLDTTPRQPAARRFYASNGFVEARRVDVEFEGEQLELCIYRKPLD